MAIALNRMLANPRLKRDLRRAATGALRSAMRIALWLPHDLAAFSAILEADPLVMRDRIAEGAAGRAYRCEIIMMIDGGYRLDRERPLAPQTREALRALAEACRDGDGHGDHGIQYGMLLPAIPGSATLRAAHSKTYDPDLSARLRQASRLLWWSGKREEAKALLSMDPAKD